MAIIKQLMDAQKQAKLPIIELQAEMPLLDDIIDELSDVVLEINPVEIVTPVNVHEEREKWLERAAESVYTNPNFIYDKGLLERTTQKRPKLMELYNEICCTLESKPTEQLVARLLKRRIGEQLYTLDLASAILRGNDVTARNAALTKYPRPNADLVETAQNYAQELLNGEGVFFNDTCELSSRQCRDLEHELYVPEKVCKMLNAACAAYDLKIRAEVDELAQVVDVRDRSAKGPRIVVPKHKKFSAMDVLRLTVHEVECHARDSANGVALLHGLGGGALKSDDETLYEGHAMVEEHFFKLSYTGKTNELPQPWHVIAESMALQCKPFGAIARAIYERMIELGKAQNAALAEAWQRAYRALRGVTDTSNPQGYAFCKDKAYFEGYRDACSLAEAELDYWLEIGVVSVDDLIEIAKVVQFSERDIKYPLRDEVEWTCRAIIEEMAG